MIAMTVGEINIICTDLERSLTFYRDVLGFEAVAREDPGYHMRCGPVRVLLLAVAGAPGAVAPYCSRPEISIDLMVDNLQDAFLLLKARNVTFVSEFEPDADRFFIRDPDGLVFEVIQT